MFLICLHAISQSVSDAFQCLKCMLFRASHANIWRLLARSKRTKRPERTLVFDLLTRDVSVCISCFSMSQKHVISCLKCMLFRASNVDVWRSLARSERMKRARCFWSAYTRFLDSKHEIDETLIRSTFSSCARDTVFKTRQLSQYRVKKHQQNDV